MALRVYGPNDLGNDNSTILRNMSIPTNAITITAPPSKQRLSSPLFLFADFFGRTTPQRRYRKSYRSVEMNGYASRGEIGDGKI